MKSSLADYSSHNAPHHASALKVVVRLHRLAYHGKFVDAPRGEVEVVSEPNTNPWCSLSYAFGTVQMVIDTHDIKD